MIGLRMLSFEFVIIGLGELFIRFSGEYPKVCVNLQTDVR